MIMKLKNTKYNTIVYRYNQTFLSKRRFFPLNPGQPLLRRTEKPTPMFQRHQLTILPSIQEVNKLKYKIFDYVENRSR